MDVIMGQKNRVKKYILNRADIEKETEFYTNIEMNRRRKLNILQISRR